MRRMPRTAEASRAMIWMGAERFAASVILALFRKPV